MDRFGHFEAAGPGRAAWGVGVKVARRAARTDRQEARAVVLGHLLPRHTTTFDRLLSLRFGAAAVRALAGRPVRGHGRLDPPTVRYVPLELVAGRMKSVRWTATPCLPLVS